jgi:alpha-tubulin suppressor-like RCC1 family protein
MSVLTAPTARPDSPASPPGPPKLSGADLRRAQAETLRTPRFRYSTPARLLFWIVDVIYGRQRTLRKFIVLEIVARVPYQAWERAAYGALTRMHRRLRLAGRIFERVTAGNSTGYALRSDGTVWAWGLNQYGQLGNESLVLSRRPVQVDGLTGVTQIAAGEYFGLALRSDGTVRSWGYNEDGELGDGTSGPEAFTDVPVQVSGLTRVTMIAAGGDNAMAARTQSLYSTLTTLVTWGPDAYGELGTGTGITYTLTPVAVTAIPAGSIRSMSMGGLETAMVLFTDGSVWEWGDPGYGQIPGAPANRGVSTPTETMAPGSGITQVSAGYTHVLALRSDGTVLAWGDDDIGQLGNGITTSVLSGPVQVTGLTNATQVAAGAGYSLAIHETLSYRGPLTR